MPDDERSAGNGLAFSFEHRRNDGYAEVSVEADGMLARADFHPPIGDGLPIAPDYVGNLLARAGVVSGIQEEAIAEACLGANIDRKSTIALVVARGVPPEPAVPEHVELSPKAAGALARAAESSGEEAPEGDAEREENPVERIDWRERSPFVVVAAGEVLGTLSGERPGSDGIDIFGKPLPAPRLAPPSFVEGENVEFADGTLRARVAGALVIAGNRVAVDPVLRLKNGIGYHTGHVTFPGDIEVSGVVRDGFRVQAGGNAVFRDTLDASDVSVHGDLDCRQGLIGRETALVRVGGSAQARFIESCRLAARGDVRVATAIVSSHIWTLGRVEAGDRGRIVGGETWAARGISCGALGNSAGIRTLVRAGSDFAVQQRLDETRTRLEKLAARTSKLRSIAKERPGARVEAALAASEREELELIKLIETLVERLDVDEGAVVDIHLEANVGVTIEICRVRLDVHQKTGKCRFRLDRNAGKIVTER
ncbi:MAG: DUF342 domain-containing protein [Spirochaetales bacterium]|nr:DUF342 domain-containing protein [Spirochaetales bacterium]